jgi:hypothetical protein
MKYGKECPAAKQTPEETDKENIKQLLYGYSLADEIMIIFRIGIKTIEKNDCGNKTDDDYRHIILQ